jgi:hypothetical protein
MLTATILAACGGEAGATEVLAQGDEVGPVQLAPPSTGADAELTIQVDVGDFADTWSDARSVALGAGGTVTEATTGIVREDGKRYSHGTVTADIPTNRLDDVLSSLGSLGTVVHSEVRLVSTARPVSVVVVTITESPSVVPAVDGPQGRIGQALETAGDILLTVLAVAIVAGAVMVPLALAALLIFAVWRRFTQTPQQPEPEQEHATVS